MEELLNKLQREKEEILSAVQVVEDNDRKLSDARIQSLKDVFAEIELVAAAVTPFTADVEQDGAINPNPSVLTTQFYASYLLVLLLARDLNDARFLWKRITADMKQGSPELRYVWEIVKSLWKRDFTAAYVAMNQQWSAELAPLVGVLRESTRDATARLLSVAYSVISTRDAACALGFDDEPLLLQYCQSLGWSVTATDGVVHPKPLPQLASQPSALEQLESLSQYVLHLEQNTVIKQV